MCNIMSFNGMQHYTNANFKERKCSFPMLEVLTSFTSSETWGLGLREGSELTTWSSRAAGSAATVVEGLGRVARFSKQICRLLLFNHPAVSSPLRPYGLQHARLPCPSPSPRVCPSSCPLHRWCHPGKYAGHWVKFEFPKDNTFFMSISHIIFGMYL